MGTSREKAQEAMLTHAALAPALTAAPAAPTPATPPASPTHTHTPATPPASPTLSHTHASHPASPTTASGMLTVIISAPNFPQPYIMDTTQLPKRRPAYETKKADGTGYERVKWTKRRQADFLRGNGVELAERGPDTVVVAGRCATLMRHKQHRSRVVAAGRVSSCRLRDEMDNTFQQQQHW
jgi:hypothetical protein